MPGYALADSLSTPESVASSVTSKPRTPETYASRARDWWPLGVGSMKGQGILNRDMEMAQFRASWGGGDSWLLSRQEHLPRGYQKAS